MFRRLSWLFLFLLPLAAMAAGEDGDTLSVTWVDGRKFVVLDYYKGYVRKAYYEDEPAARERFRRDSAGLFLDRCYPFGPDTAVDAAVPEDVRVCHFPRIRVKPYWPQPPYWLKAFREALSPASIYTLLRGGDGRGLGIEFGSFISKYLVYSLIEGFLLGSLPSPVESNPLGPNPGPPLIQ